MGAYYLSSVLIDLLLKKSEPWCVVFVSFLVEQKMLPLKEQQVQINMCFMEFLNTLPMRMSRQQSKIRNRKKVGYIHLNTLMEILSLLLGGKANKQVDEKREKGAAQILVPSRLIFAGRLIFNIFQDERIFFVFRRI